MDEQSLIARASTGDTDAFNSLVIIHQSKVYGLAYRVLGDADAAADITQETFISAFRAIHGYRGGSFRGWLFRIATNACTDHFRGRSRKPTSSLEAMQEAGVTDAFASGGPDPERTAIAHESAREIQKGLMTLSSDQRIALVMRDVQGFSYEEIAEATATNLGTVKSRIGRARENMRAYLIEHTELIGRGKRQES